MISGPWSAGVPDGWAIRPLWSEFRRGKSLGEGTEELLSVYRDYGVIPKSSRDDNFNKPSEDLSKYQRVFVGDLVVNKMKAWQGSLGVSDYDGIVSPAYFVYKAIGELNRRFAHYLLRSREYADHMAAISSGIRPNQWDLDPAQFAVTPLLVPPPREQRAIADYLDRETAQIDAFIAKNEELITVLTERRAATISELVLRGTDPSAPLRESGVEGMGMVPAHWGTQPIVTLARVLTSTVDKKSYPGELPVRLCNYTDVYYSDVIRSGDGLMEATANRDQIARFSVLAGDVPFTKDSETSDDIGISSYVARDLPGVVYGYHLGIYRPNDTRRSKYIKYLLDTAYVKDYFVRRTPGVTRVGLGQSVIRYLRAPVPPVDEAMAVADEIERAVGRIDSSLSLVRAGITLARERRAALISAAVTGKIDVGVAA